MTENEKTLICFPNSFGFGPSGILLQVLKKIKPFWKGDIIIASSDWSQEIFKNMNFKFKIIDERSEEKILDFIKQYKNPYVFTSMNRFAIQACKKDKIPCVFLDNLSWFWDNIPEYYFDANRYYTEDIFDVELNINKLKTEYKEKVRIVPLIGDYDDFKAVEIKTSNNYYMAISGLKNPFFKDFLPESYLKLIAEALNNVNTNNKTIYISSCRSNLEFLKKYINNKNIICDVFERDFFLTLIKTSNHIITTGGLNIMKDALCNNKPLSSFLPMNKSLWQIVKNSKNKEYLQNSLEWEKYIDIDEVKLKNMTEKDAIPYFVDKSNELANNSRQKELFIADFTKIFEQKINKEKLVKLNYGGEDLLVKDLINFWKI